MSHLMTKPTKWHVCPAKTQISLGIRPVWSESSLYAQWVAKDPSFLVADSKDSDQTGRMPRLIWVSPSAHAFLLVLSWDGSNSRDISVKGLKFQGRDCTQMTILSDFFFFFNRNLWTLLSYDNFYGGPFLRDFSFYRKEQVNANNR